MNILVAGFGNVLREDDAFGIRLLERLRIRATEFPSVRFFEAGIGGINFVQELQDGFDALIVLDALEAEDQAAPGTVRVLEAQVLDPRQMPVHVARDALADIHYAEPGRAMALATLEIGQVILAFVGLGFLGLGAVPPAPEWGATINEARNYLFLAPQLTLYPGAAILLAVLGFNLLGDGLRDAFDPKGLLGSSVG